MTLPLFKQAHSQNACEFPKHGIIGSRNSLSSSFFNAAMFFSENEMAGKEKITAGLDFKKLAVILAKVVGVFKYILTKQALFEPSGVCTLEPPFYIVTEYMPYGNLLDYL